MTPNPIHSEISAELQQSHSAFDREYYAAIAWYNTLNYEQQIFLSSYYSIPISSDKHGIVHAYKNRDETHNHRDWPVSKYRSI